MEAASLEAGDSIYLQVQDDPPGSILLIPVEVVTRWLEQGRRLDSRSSLGSFTESSEVSEQ